MEDLLPCPFCGAIPVIRVENLVKVIREWNHEYKITLYSICCRSCEIPVVTVRRDKEEVIRLWNTRI